MSWDAAQYDRFPEERDQPFADLMAMCEPVRSGTAVDLRCGTGRSLLRQRLVPMGSWS